MFRVTLTLNRQDVSTMWEDPSRSIGIVLDVLAEAGKRNISVSETFSTDNLTRQLIWSAPSEEVWNEFSQNFILTDGEIDNSWYDANNITYQITRENINE